MKKLTNKEIEDHIREFDRQLEEFLIKLHDKVYEGDSRDPSEDPELIEEYSRCYENVRDVSQAVLCRELKRWGTPEKNIDFD